MSHRAEGTLFTVEGGAGGVVTAVSALPAVLGLVPGLLLGCDEAGRILLANPAALDFLDATSTGLDGHTLVGLLTDVPDLAEGETLTFQTGLQRPGGSVIQAKCQASRVEADGVRMALLHFQPVSDVAADTEHVTQAQKLEAIGQLAAGIAHEINTPTQYVGDNTRFLKDAFDSLTECRPKYQRLLQAAKAGEIPPEIISDLEATLSAIDADFLMAEIPQAIEQSLEGLDQIARIVRALKDFSHPGMGEKTFLDVNSAIENTLTVTRHEWKYLADVVTRLDANIPLVPCLPGAFNQVLLNIIVNAAHAIEDAQKLDPRKGTITVETRTAGHYVEVRIGDTGVGIPEHVRSKVYDPFFTTKEVGRGTGQGLALSYSIVVEKHGGTLSFESEPGCGTTFIIRLPSTVAPSQEACA
jgi:signal transduction histidine kinase